MYLMITGQAILEKEELAALQELRRIADAVNGFAGTPGARYIELDRRIAATKFLERELPSK